MLYSRRSFLRDLTIVAISGALAACGPEGPPVAVTLTPEPTAVSDVPSLRPTTEIQLTADSGVGKESRIIQDAVNEYGLTQEKVNQTVKEVLDISIYPDWLITAVADGMKSGDGKTAKTLNLDKEGKQKMICVFNPVLSLGGLASEVVASTGTSPRVANLGGLELLALLIQPYRDMGVWSRKGFSPEVVNGLNRNDDVHEALHVLTVTKGLIGCLSKCGIDPCDISSLKLSTDDQKAKFRLFAEYIVESLHPSMELISWLENGRAHNALADKNQDGTVKEMDKNISLGGTEMVGNFWRFYKGLDTEGGNYASFEAMAKAHPDLTQWASFNVVYGQFVGLFPSVYKDVKLP